MLRVLSLVTALLICSTPLRAEALTEDSGSLAAALRPFVDGQVLAGAVLMVVDKDRVLAEETVGFSDIAASRPMVGDSLFWIASMSKPITATAVMLLVDDGKLSIDDPVEKYLPEFGKLWVASEKTDARVVLTKPATKITIRHILSHTSGLPFSTDIEAPTRDLLPMAVATRDYATVPLLSEPGTKYLYSNAGINTAGRIIEVVSGLKYEEFLQRRLFDPLAMRDTTFFPTSQQLTRLARSYKPASKAGGLAETTASQLHYPLDDPQRQPMPGGGLFSTARDCASFCRMILSSGERDGRRILSSESIDVMSRRHTPETLKESYGLGWQVGGSKTFGHGGAFATNMTIDRERGLAYVYMVQHAGFHENAGGKILETFHKVAKERYGR